MAQFTNALAQTVAINGNVLFSDNPVPACPCVRHRDGSGTFIFRGGHKYLIEFSANVANPAATNPVILALTINGEELPSSRMISTPTGAGEYQNVSTALELVVPQCCCFTVAVRNIGSNSTLVQNANLLIFRED